MNDEHKQNNNMLTMMGRLAVLLISSTIAFLPSPTRSFILSPSRIHPQRDISLCASSDTFSLSSSSQSFLATCIPGLAHVLADELEEIHPQITDVAVSGNSAVTFVATREASLHALVWCRTAHRLLELIAMTGDQGPLLYDRGDLHDFIASEVDIKNLLGDGQGGLLTLSVKTILNKPRQLPKDLSHSHFTALSIKNAICDVVRDGRGDRPSVDVENPDVPLVAILLGTNEGGASLSLYRSLHPPGSLHKRGYRQGSAIHKASMKESLAAGLLREAGWHAKVKAGKEDDKCSLRLIDPMCGSGSFLLEAAMISADIAPGLMRIRCNVPYQKLPPVTRWKSDLNTKQMWKQVLLDASARAKAGLGWINEDLSRIRLYANDIHPGALEIMESSLDAAGFFNLVRITNMDCFDLLIDEADKECSVPYFVVTNPPWGIRLTEDIAESWESLRHFLRDVCPQNTEAWILSGHKGATGTLKLKRDRMVPVQTGDQHLRWIQYTIGDTKAQEQREKTNNKNLKVQAPPKKFSDKRIAKNVVVAQGKTNYGRASKNEWLVD